MTPNPESRVTVIEQVSYIQPNLDPTTWIGSHDQYILGGGQPYMRILYLPADQVLQIESGWIEKIAYLFIGNTTKAQPYASPQELKDLEEKQLEISFLGSEFSTRLKPKQTLKFTYPSRVDLIQLKSLSGVLQLRYLLIPE